MSATPWRYFAEITASLDRQSAILCKLSRGFQTDPKLMDELLHALDDVRGSLSHLEAMYHRIAREQEMIDEERHLSIYPPGRREGFDG